MENFGTGMLDFLPAAEKGSAPRGNLRVFGEDLQVVAVAVDLVALPSRDLVEDFGLAKRLTKARLR